MFSDPTQVIVTTEHGPQPLVHALYVHHREFPEVCGEGASAQEAANQLAEKLSLALEHAPSQWRRDGIRLAIADVRAFAEESRLRSYQEATPVDPVAVTGKAGAEDGR